jgi:hypothetical protein
MTYSGKQGQCFAWLVTVAALSAVACGSSDGTSEAALFDRTHESSITADSETEATAYPEAVLITAIAGSNQVACSGTLISPHVVLTTAMCLHRFGSWQVTFPGVGGQSVVATSGATFDWSTTNPDRHNVGVIFLNTPVSLARFPTLASSPVVDGTLGSALGRVKSGVLSNTAAFVTADINLKGGAASGAPHDYVSSGSLPYGNQGGAVELLDHTIVAIASGSANGMVNWARVDLVSSWLHAQMRLAGDEADVAAWIDMSQNANACANQAGVACGWSPTNNGQGYTCALRHPEWKDGWTCEP